jgi:hypothetical protein
MSLAELIGMRCTGARFRMECEKTAEFLPGQDVLEELHSIFLTDAKDDPQIRADRDEISALLSKLDSNRKAPQ